MQATDNLAHLLTRFVEHTDEQQQESLGAVAKAFARSALIQPRAHMGGAQNLKASLQAELTRNTGTINEATALSGIAGAQGELRQLMEGRARVLNRLFYALAGIPAAGMIGLLACAAARLPFLVTLPIFGLVLLAEAVFFLKYKTEQGAMGQVEANYIRLKMLEGKLQVAQQVGDLNLRNMMYQAITASLVSDQQDAAQMVVHNWGGKIGKVVSIGQVHGNVQ